MSLDNVRVFLDKNKTCVLSTVNAKGWPEAATVGFSVYKNKFFIVTSQKTRKYQNLNSNNHVALVVGFEGAKTFQLNGEAQEVAKIDCQEALNVHFDKVPEAKRYANDPDQRYFLITPAWLRFTDYTAPEPIFETKDFS